MNRRAHPHTSGLRLAMLLVLLAIGAVLPTKAAAHIGSKDIFEQVQAGPYKLFVTIRPPVVIPGVATVEARSSGAPVSSIAIAPVPLTGEAAKHPPTPDQMKPSPDDPAFFTGSLWLMASGSWQVRMTIDGPAGRQTTGVPVPAMPLSVMRMQRPLGAVLAVLGLLLVLGMTGIVAAAVREARLRPGIGVSPASSRRGLLAGAGTLMLMIAAVALGNAWWNVEARSYAADLYHPSGLRATLHGDTLQLELGAYDGGKKAWAADSPAELLPDHGHLMHLYAIRWPAMDAAYHLHPEALAGTDMLAEDLPSMPAGRYRLFGDIVHHNGFPETVTTTIDIPAGLRGTGLSSEDAEAFPPPVGHDLLGASYRLPDGYVMAWDRPAVIHANEGYSFRFRLLDASGKPAQDVVPYLGMAGHAAWVKVDGTVFAHTHPEGSAAMPAMMMAQEQQSEQTGAASGAMAEMPGMSGMARPTGENVNLTPVVEFPYGFPSAGRYRVFVQMKHGSTVETGVFDVQVE